MSAIFYDPPDHGTPEASPLLAGLRNGAWLDDQDFPPLAYVVPGLVPEGAVLLVGPPKIGKSWLVLTVALAAASGGKALGLDVPKYPVLYLALEDGDRRLQDRCRKLLRGDPIPAEFEYLTNVEPGRILDTVAAWADLKGDPPLVILDTVGKVLPPAMPGESGYSRDYRVGATLKRLTDERPGMTLLANHHDRKAHAEDFVDSVSATHGLAGAFDTVMVLSRPRLEADGLIKVTGRDVPEGEYAISFQDGHCWTLSGDGLTGAAKAARAVRATAGLGDRAAEVVAYATRQPEPVSAAQVADALGLDPNLVRVYLNRAVDAGRLERAGRGRFTTPPVTTVTSVTSEGEDPFERNSHNTSNTPIEGRLLDDGEHDDPARWTR